MEAARARKSKLMTSQKEEDERVINMPDWSPQEDKGADREQLISREDRVCCLVYLCSDELVKI